MSDDSEYRWILGGLLGICLILCAAGVATEYVHGRYPAPPVCDPRCAVKP